MSKFISTIEKILVALVAVNSYTNAEGQEVATQIKGLSDAGTATRAENSTQIFLPLIVR